MLVAPLAFAAGPTLEVSVIDDAPLTISSPSAAPSTVTPELNKTKRVNVSMIAADGNGWGDIEASVVITAPDGTNQTVAITPTANGGSATEALIRISIPVTQYTLPGIYTVTFQVGDGTSSISPAPATTYTVNTLVALEITSTSLDFGTLVPGAKSNTTLVVENVGNVPINVVTESDGLADVDTIPASALGWSLAGGGWTQFVSGVEIPVTIPVGEGSTDSIMWQLTVPTVRPGQYAGEMTLVAIVSE